MNTSAFWMIVLGLWIWALQNRIKMLEEQIEALRSKMVRSLEKEFSTTEAHSALEEEKEEKETHAIPQTFQTLSKEREETVERVDFTPVLEKKEMRHKEPTPSHPSWLMQLLRAYFSGGNLLVRIGGIILFFGLAFLVKYASEHISVSITFRLLGVLFVGVVLIVLGWRLRFKEGAYGQILQGVGVAVLYLVLYASEKFYALLSLETAFGGMFLVVILGALLAEKQVSLPLALFSTAGGFLVPILTASGKGSHLLLFSYYLLLNLGIVLMAWRHAWRLLNMVGFLFTFVIATLWGVLHYHPALFATTEPFLILYFLIYLVITIRFAEKSRGHIIDGTLLFGLPAVVFPLQVQLVSGMAYAEGYSAVAMGTLYLLLANILHQKSRNRLLWESFYGLGTLFYTIAVPYFLNADITAAIWAMESSALVWLSLKQQRVWGRYFAEILLVVSTGLYLLSQAGMSVGVSEYLGYLIVVLSAFWVAYMLERHSKQLGADRYFSSLFLLLSFAVWMLSVYKVAQVLLPYELGHALLFGFLLGTLLLFLADTTLQWAFLGKLLQLTLPLGGVLFLRSFMTHFPLNPFEGLGGVVFVILMLWHTFLLYRYDKIWQWRTSLHLFSLWFSVAVLTLALRHSTLMAGLDATMVLLCVALLPLLYSLFLMYAPLEKLGISAYLTLYRYVGVGGLLAFLACWEIGAFFFHLEQNPLPYLPLFNLLDMMQLLILFLSYQWVRTYQKEKIFTLPLFVTAMVLLSVIFARAVAYYGEYPYRLHSLWSVGSFQTGLSLLWSLTALLLMFLSKKYHQRKLWIVGFVLLCLVVFKLFFVELSGSGTMERIVSFIAVGLLLLLIGYLVPMPPEEKLSET